MHNGLVHTAYISNSYDFIYGLAGSYRVLAVLLPSWRVRLETAAGNTAEEKSIFTEVVLRRRAQGPTNTMQIHRALNTPAIDQAFVAAIRLLVADYLSRHKSDPCTAGADADCSFTWDQWANGLMDAGRSRTPGS